MMKPLSKFRTTVLTGRLTQGVFTAVMLLASCLVTNSAVAQKAPNFCTQISKDMLESCQDGVESDFSLAIAKCDNLPTPDKTCLQQASADKKDALKTCKEQHDLRQAACGRLGGAPYAPVINAANFPNSTTIDNPLFPLKPGTTFIYEGQTADGFEHVEFAVTHNTKVILGVTCIEVHDTRKVNGAVLEDTRDWFAQDKDGNVWYFGENTTLVDSGLPVDLSGTWTGGVDGAQPGIIMEAHPAIGDFYRQEFSLDNAEDLAEVKSLSESVTVPFPPGSFHNCLETEESSSLAPGDVEHKFYAAGVGNLLTVDLATGERSELVQIITE